MNRKYDDYYSVGKVESSPTLDRVTPYLVIVLLLGVLEVASMILIKTPAVTYFRSYRTDFFETLSGLIDSTHSTMATPWRVPPGFIKMVPPHPSASKGIRDPRGIQVRYDADCRWDQRAKAILLSPSSTCKRQLFYLPTKQALLTVQETIDGSGARRSSDRGAKKQYVAMLGDEFVYGEGLADNETLASQFNEVADDMHAYNFGSPDVSPADSYLRMQNENMRSAMREGGGYILYFISQDQMRRFEGALSYMATDGAAHHVIVNDNGKVNADSTFEEAHPEWVGLARKIWKSSAIRFLGLDWPIYIKSAEVENFVAMLKSMSESSQARYPNSKFVVVLLPGVKYSGDVVEAIDRERLNFLDYSRMEIEQFTDSAPYQELSGRYTVAATKTLGKMIADDLKTWVSK